VAETKRVALSQVDEDGNIQEFIVTTVTLADGSETEKTQYLYTAPDGKVTDSTGKASGAIKDRGTMTKALHAAIPADLKTTYKAKLAAEAKAIADAEKAAAEKAAAAAAAAAAALAPGGPPPKEPVAP